MRKSLGFTLAEVLITLAIIGVVAAMTIPSVIINTNQQEYKTGLKKAISVLNQAITMNMALENKTPADCTNTTNNKTQNEGSLMNYLASRLNIIKETEALEFGKGKNAAFYTSDGMRFEFPIDGTKAGEVTFSNVECGDGNTAEAKPCLIVVDVNGDRRPSPASVTDTNEYAKVNPNGTRITDVFSVMITDTAAVPFGVAAQRTMFQADDK